MNERERGAFLAHPDAWETKKTVVPHLFVARLF
jgi:hypothetical protein